MRYQTVLLNIVREYVFLVFDVNFCLRLITRKENSSLPQLITNLVEEPLQKLPFIECDYNLEA